MSRAVECPEEPYHHPIGPGDVEVRFHPLGSYDISAMDVVVEVRSKYLAGRADDRQRRCDFLRDLLVNQIGVTNVGVYLSMPIAAWAQS